MPLGVRGKGLGVKDVDLSPYDSRLTFNGFSGAVAQLGEHLLCKQGVGGSIPLSSTSFYTL